LKAILCRKVGTYAELNRMIRIKKCAGSECLDLSEQHVISLYFDVENTKDS